ncbi:hypothetical protein LZ32DRAFT_676385 [Colletotrichum eremochloae]|nr:hypothetical protein LZ32DRAFT_676385 [Colletotrichum eremochloae]
MKFSMLKYAAVALATHCSSVLSQATPQQVVDNINGLTQKSQALQAPAQSITLVNTPLIVIGQGPFPVIIRGFVDIVNTANVYIQSMQGMAPVPAGAKSDAIFDAFRVFVHVHQQLLNILIGKAGLLQNVPVIGPPVASVLRQVESVVDTIAFGLIDTVESRAADLHQQAASLGATLDVCIEKYEGIA